MKRYSGKIFNSNGYEIAKEGNSISSVKSALGFYPLEVFDGWIYDRKTDSIVCRLERVGTIGESKGWIKEG